MLFSFFSSSLPVAEFEDVQPIVNRLTCYLLLNSELQDQDIPIIWFIYSLLDNDGHMSRDVLNC